MAYQVTSWFVDQTAEKTSAPKRVFTIGDSDYSGRVLRWPRLARSWNDIRPVALSIDLSNEDQEINFFKDDKTHLRSECKVSIGFTHPDSGDELIDVFTGRVDKVKYSRGLVNLQMLDKIKDFAEAVVGTSDEPVTFTDTDYLPSEIAWTLVTCYGGLVDSRDAANEDIDYPSFETWAGVWSGDNVFMKARFDGVKVNDALRRLGRVTNSAIFVENNKLGFFRFAEADSHETLIDDDTAMGITLEIDDQAIVNKQWVYAAYDVDSRYHTIATFGVNIASVNSFGLREEVERDESIWYVSSATAQNLAERLVDFASSPYEKYRIEGALTPLARQIGETVRIVDGYLGVNSSFTWRVMGYEIDLDRGRSAIQVDGSQIYQDFILDDDLFGILDDGPGRLL